MFLNKKLPLKFQLIAPTEFSAGAKLMGKQKIDNLFQVYLILCKLACVIIDMPDTSGWREVRKLLHFILYLILTVIAGVLVHVFCKWLDSRRKK